MWNRQTSQKAQAFLSRLEMGMNKVTRIHKKDMRLDRVHTKAKPETGDWRKTLQRIASNLGLRMIRMVHYELAG